MEKLPSLMTTYERVFKLYTRTFIDVLPILLIVAACQYAIDRYMPITETQENITIIATNAVLQFLLIFLLFAYLIAFIYAKHHGQPIGLGQALSQGLARLIPYLASIILLVLPVVIVLVVMAFIAGFIAGYTGHTSETVNSTLLLIGIILAIMYGLFLLYFYVSPVCIIAEKQGPISGLSKSRNLTRNHWFATFALIICYSIIVGILSFVLGKFLDEAIVHAIITVLTSSFTASLIVVHHDHLTKAALPIVPATNP